MRSNFNHHIEAFWKSALLWIMTNKEASSTWLPDEELLRKIRTFNTTTKYCNVNDLNRALNNDSLMGWINGICRHKSEIFYVAKNKKQIKLANGKLQRAFFYLISSKPIVPIDIPKNIKVYQEAWDQNQSTTGK